MAPKKSSPFMVFLMELKNKPGHKLSMESALAKADGLWKQMTEKERQVYVDKAKKAPPPQSSKGNKKNSERLKLNCFGKPISVVEKEQEEAEMKDRFMKNSIATIVHNGATKGELETTSYIFISVNYFNKSVECDLYVPAEISLAEFSLKSGVNRTFHTLINPGSTTYGYLYDAQEHAKTTHNLPLPPMAMGENDLSSVYQLIMDFIKSDTGVYQPVYTAAENIPIVEGVLRFLEMHRSGEKGDIQVFSIQHLLFVMKDETAQLGELERPASHFVTDVYFERDFFEYQSGIACDFHEEIDRSKYCSKSCVIRWGFMFAELMCNDVAIKLIPGRHCPKQTEVSYLVEPPKEESVEEKWHTVGPSTSRFGSRSRFGRGRF